MSSLIKSGRTVERAALVTIAILSAIAALYFGKDIAAPLVFAFVMAVVLAPLHDALCGLRVNRGLGAAILLVMLLLVVSVLGLMAEPVVKKVIVEIPNMKRELRLLAFEFQAMFRGLENLNDDVQSIIGSTTDQPADGATQVPSALDAALFAPFVVGQVLLFLGALFFALVERRSMYRALAHAMGQPSVRQRLGRAEKAVATYFGTIALINLGLGLAVALALSALGLPLPFVWGAAAAALNFVLYVGPAMMVVMLTLAGILNFDGLMVLAPPAAFLTINAIEAQFVTPSVVGKHMNISPLLVFLSVVFWLWLWGAVGAIIAIPLLVFWVGFWAPEPAKRTEHARA